MYSSYDKRPEIRIEGFDHEAWQGFEAIGHQLRNHMPETNTYIFDCYPGVDDSTLLPALISILHPDTVIKSEDIFYADEALLERISPFLTEDRVRGIRYWGTMDLLIDPQAWQETILKIKNAQGTVLIYGFAAARLAQEGVLIYADMTRWEIQLRYRRGMANFKQHNGKDEFLKKVKNGFFIDWRIADRHKETLYDRVDYFLDTVCPDMPKMISGIAFRTALDRITQQPFRLVPYFDAGVWGGHWMQNTFDLDEGSPNYAWCFDGVPEENSILLRLGNVLFETPAMNITLRRPIGLLGEKTYARFGAEFPIRFDMLDTIGGQNLSLQVHPTTDYMQKHFAMPYTQDESYYILATGSSGGHVYLGLKPGVNKSEMFSELRHAQNGEINFNAEKYVQKWQAKAHDHFLIPGGTIHCSGRDTMVLEISATPYIFTFKLWDWGRVDLDGKPRPIHIDDGEQVIRMDRDTDWTKKNCVNAFTLLSENEDYSVTRTGLHETEFIETLLFTVRTRALLPDNGEVAMCNLVAGKEALITYAEGSFIVHYAETFILPARVGPCSILNTSNEKEIKLICAKVRF